MANLPGNAERSTNVLVTAFGPYDRWSENASWLCLVELIRDLPGVSHVTTRRYPVDLQGTKKMLADDLRGGYDFALHLGQSPGATSVQLETIGVNAYSGIKDSQDSHQLLEEQGPVAYRSALPLDRWAGDLRGRGIPAEVSFHAGTYLCNAALYWSHHIAEQEGFRTQSCFVHLPLTPEQVVASSESLPAMPTSMTAAAVRWMLDQLRPV